MLLYQPGLNEIKNLLILMSVINWRKFFWRVNKKGLFLWSCILRGRFISNFVSSISFPLHTHSVNYSISFSYCHKFDFYGFTLNVILHRIIDYILFFRLLNFTTVFNHIINMRKKSAKKKNIFICTLWAIFKENVMKSGLLYYTEWNLKFVDFGVKLATRKIQPSIWKLLVMGKQIRAISLVMYSTKIV